MNTLCPCFLFCCQNTSSDEEREPILVAQSARLNQPRNHKPRDGRISVRHVGQANLNHRFSDFEESFNKQQDNYESLKETRKILMFLYGCSEDESLSTCLKKINEEHESHQVRLQMKGYDFSLVLHPNDQVPDKLKQTQKNIKELCQAIKAIMSIGPKLQEMISSLLKDEEKLIQQVRDGVKSHQDTQRLCDNLKWNLQEVSRAKDLSLASRAEADRFLKEVAELSGYEP